MAQQCSGITKSGRRCSLTAHSKLRDERGGLVAEPLRRGGLFCRIHAKAFVHRSVSETPASAVIVFIDFETTGLDVWRDEIVEIGAAEALTGSVFSSVVSAASVPAAPAVHGIDREEIAQGPPFPEVWRRFTAFAEGLVDMTVVDDSESSQDCPHRALPSLPEEPPVLVLAAHNGFRFDFAMLLCECCRHDVSWAPLQRWLFVDTLSVLQAVGDTGACMKLQCLAHAAGNVDGLRAHRALDDCYALRAVLLQVAARLGLNLWSLLHNFAVALDPDASMAQVSVLLGE